MSHPRERHGITRGQLLKGAAGSALVFLNYLQELPFFVQEVLPRMEKAGLRQPHHGE